MKRLDLDDISAAIGQYARYCGTGHPKAQLDCTYPDKSGMMDRGYPHSNRAPPGKDRFAFFHKGARPFFRIVRGSIFLGALRFDSVCLIQR